MFYTYYADTLITLMLGWIRGFTDWIWKLISLSGSSSGRGFLGWFSENWLRTVCILILIGVAADWLVWLIRWRPYWLWFGKKRRILDDIAQAPAAVPAHEAAAARAGSKPQAPHFKSKALPRAETARTETYFEEDEPEDDLFDVVSSAIPVPKAKNAQPSPVGASVNQYIETKPRASAAVNREQPKNDEIDWFE